MTPWVLTGQLCNELRLSATVAVSDTTAPHTEQAAAVIGAAQAASTPPAIPA
jgi:hypothetical protein